MGNMLREKNMLSKKLIIIQGSYFPSHNNMRKAYRKQKLSHMFIIATLCLRYFSTVNYSSG